jgi:asparagine synthase (glutamine-hydrolysing)
MCGIVGKYSLKGSISNDDEQRLKVALDLQNHRGPDAQGIWRGDSAILGHNRLSIIDLSQAADQPLYRADLGLRIIFNGEIYNYQLLRSSLQKQGYEFTTTSDTEVILAAYAHWGKALCEYLTGMFAFAIWDEQNEELFIARDRFGEKPIFFINHGDGFYFASELNALRTIYPRELTINQDAVIDLVEYLYINLHHSIYQEVSVFPPASTLSISKDGAKNWGQYYKYPTQVGENIDFDSLKKQTKEKLFQTVERELHADVPVATFLSAGVDSGLITAIAHEIKPDLQAVTMATNEEATDETDGAKSLARKLGIKHEIVPVNTDSLEVLGKILTDIQPLADASLIPSFMVTEQIKDRYTVMLSGDGGDEIFGSYNRPNRYLKLKRKSIPGGQQFIDWAFSVKNPALSGKLMSFLNDEKRMLLNGWQGLYSRHNLSGGSLFQSIFRSGKEQNYPKSLIPSLEIDYKGNFEKLTFGLDVKTRLPGDFLFKVDSAAMHSSVEVRAPFLDHELVDFLSKVPVESLMPNGVDKELSKSLLSDYSGESWHPPKRGFTIPYWLYLQGPWGDQLESFLDEGLSESYFNFNKEGIRSILQQHRQRSNSTYARILFSLLILEIWLRVFHLKKELVFLSKKQKIK